jgi:hypothetical protein
VPFPPWKWLIDWLHFIVDNGIEGNPLFAGINANEKLTGPILMDTTQFGRAARAWQAHMAVLRPCHFQTVGVKNMSTSSGDSASIGTR